MREIHVFQVKDIGNTSCKVPCGKPNTKIVWTNLVQHFLCRLCKDTNCMWWLLTSKNVLPRRGIWREKYEHWDANCSDEDCAEEMSICFLRRVNLFMLESSSRKCRPNRSLILLKITKEWFKNRNHLVEN